MEFLQGTTPELRHELRTYLYRYRHQPTPQQAIAFGALMDLDQALRLMAKLAKGLPEGLPITLEVEAFLASRAKPAS